MDGKTRSRGTGGRLKLANTLHDTDHHAKNHHDRHNTDTCADYNTDNKNDYRASK